MQEAKDGGTMDICGGLPKKGTPIEIPKSQDSLIMRTLVLVLGNPPMCPTRGFR